MDHQLFRTTVNVNKEKVVLFINKNHIQIQSNRFIYLNYILYIVDSQQKLKETEKLFDAFVKLTVI